MATSLSDRSAAPGAAVHDRPKAIDAASSLGLSLKRLRERRGLALEQIAADTKIPQRRLEAIERDADVAATEEFYRRAEIRVYARALGYDERLAMAEFDRMRQPVQIEAPVPERLRTSPAKLLSPARVLIVVAVVVTAAVIGRAMRESQPVVPVGVQVAPQAPNSSTSRTQDSPRDVAPTPAPLAIPSSASRVNATPTSGSIVPANTDTVRPTTTTSGELVISTEPAGARVTVNGIGWGLAPLTVRHLEPGIKRIRVTKDGYAAEERVLQMIEGETATVAIRLTRIP